MYIKSRIFNLVQGFEVPVNGVLGLPVEGLVEEVRENFELVRVVGQSELADTFLARAVQAYPVVQCDQRSLAVRIDHRGYYFLEVRALKNLFFNEGRSRKICTSYSRCNRCTASGSGRS